MNNKRIDLKISFRNYYLGKKRFFNALFIGTLSAVTSQGLNFIVIILITRELGTEYMGRFSIIQSTVMMLLTFGIIGQNVSATVLTSRFKKRYPNQLGYLLGNSYLISFFMATLVGLFTFCTANHFFKEIFIESVPPFLSLFLVVAWFCFMTFDMMQVSILIGMEVYRDLIKTDLIKGLFAIIAIFPLSVHFELLGVIVGYTVVNFLGVGINQWFIRRRLKELHVKIKFEPNLRMIRHILNIGLPIFIASVFMSPTNWGTNKIIFNADNGPVALGVVFVCRQILILIQFFPAQISRVLLPIIAENNNDAEEATIKKISLGLSLLICICLALAALFFENTIFSMYNLNGEIAKWPFRIILITVLFATSNLILGQFIIAGKNPWIRTYADIALSVTMLILTLVLVNLNTFLALPLAMLFSFIASNIVLLYFIIYRHNTSSTFNILKQITKKR